MKALLFLLLLILISLFTSVHMGKTQINMVLIILQIVDALEEGQDAQVDHLAFKMVEIEQILANEDSSDEHDV